MLGLRLFFYDPAGEMYNEGDNYALLHCLDLMDGVIIFIDPLVILGTNSQYAERIEELKRTNTDNFRIGGDTRDIVQYLKEELYQRTYRDYEYEKRHNDNDVHFYLEGNEYHYARCAVVITKSDVKTDKLNLDAIVGEAAIQQEISSNPSLNYEDAMNVICRRLLQETWGSELQFLDEMFNKKVRCFSVSSFGHMPSAGSPFTPQRVELPLLWLLQEKYAKILDKRK
ncbi:hypothetical protein FACS189427_06150 [Planctomycetales bacterium]|nr:hypothetical protein FACS189427_06150 [Planctomycetales bacterium]